MTVVYLNRQEAAALGLVSEQKDAPPVACELNEKGYMVRLADDHYTIRSALPQRCPFCSSVPHVGHENADDMSVSCECGARMIVSCPDEYPKGISTNDELDRYMGLQAIARWNRRPA